MAKIEATEVHTFIDSDGKVFVATKLHGMLYSLLCILKIKSSPRAAYTFSYNMSGAVTYTVSGHTTVINGITYSLSHNAATPVKLKEKKVKSTRPPIKDSSQWRQLNTKHSASTGRQNTRGR